MAEEENETPIVELDRHRAVSHGSHLKLKVKLNTEKEAKYYRLNRKTKIRKLLKDFCKRAGIDYRSTDFIIEGRGFSHHKTPDQLGLEDRAQVDAMIYGPGA